MSGGVTLADMAFYFLSRAVLQDVWMGIWYRRQAAQDGREANTRFGANLRVAVVSQLVALSLCTAGRES